MNKLNINKISKNLPKNRVKVDVYKEIDSTNDQAKRIDLIKEYQLIAAESQSKGRGRLGKRWFSPNSGNIYMTLCTEKDLSFAPVSLITGLICKKSILNLNKLIDIKLKWPNDILFENKKVGGILIEEEHINSNIKTMIGIGINLDIEDKESWWGDLSEYKLESKRSALINIIISKLLKFNDNYNEDWINKWKASCAHMNKEVKIYEGKEFIEKTIFKDIDSKGNAILESKNGIKKIRSGQISIKGIY